MATDGHGARPASDGWLGHPCPSVAICVHLWSSGEVTDVVATILRARSPADRRRRARQAARCGGCGSTLLGLTLTGDFRSESENVDEDIAVAGAGPLAVEVDLMQPLDPEKRPKVHEPPLNHVGLWVDDLHAAVAWLDARRACASRPGGIRKGAAGYDVCFIHPKGNEQSPDRRRGRADRARAGAARGDRRAPRRVSRRPTWRRPASRRASPGSAAAFCNADLQVADELIGVTCPGTARCGRGPAACPCRACATSASQLLYQPPPLGWPPACAIAANASLQLGESSAPCWRRQCMTRPPPDLHIRCRTSGCRPAQRLRPAPARRPPPPTAVSPNSIPPASRIDLLFRAPRAMSSIMPTRAGPLKPTTGGARRAARGRRRRPARPAPRTSPRARRGPPASRRAAGR